MPISGLFKGKMIDVDTLTTREITTAAPSAALTGDTTNSEGVATTLARADHSHDITTAAPQAMTVGAANAEGTAAGLARADHVHSVASATPESVGTSNDEGISTGFARADHIHDLSAAAQTAVLNSDRKAFGFAANDVAQSATTTLQTDAFTKSIIDGSQSKKIGGSSSASGVGTDAPSTTTENKVQIRDATTGDPFQDASSRQVFGRLTAASTAITANLTWDGSTTILTSDTSEAVVGEFIRLTSDGQLFEIGVVNTNVSFVVSNLAGKTIPTGSGASASSKVDLTLSYFVDISGTETAHTHDGSTADLIPTEALGLAEAPFNAILTGVGFAEVLPAGHTHDDRYFTETEQGAVGSANPNVTSGAALIGTDASAIGPNAGTTDHVQAVLEAHDTAITAAAAGSGTPNAEAVAAQVITGTDTALTAQLVNTPTDNDTVQLVLNNAVFTQSGLPGVGAGEAHYSISGKVITWLAATGLAPDLTADDQIIVYYTS